MSSSASTENGVGRNGEPNGGVMRPLIDSERDDRGCDDNKSDPFRQRLGAAEENVADPKSEEAENDHSRERAEAPEFRGERRIIDIWRFLARWIE